MLYLSGVVRAEVLNRPDCGVVLTPAMGNRPDLSATRWAADIGELLTVIENQERRLLARETPQAS